MYCWMKTSMTGKILLLICMGAQGLLMRRLCDNIFMSISLEWEEPDLPQMPTTTVSKPVVTDSNTTATGIGNIHAVDPTTHVDLQLDVMVPVYERDDRLRAFAYNMGKAVSNYHKKEQKGARITTFRLVVTRFSPEEVAGSDELQQELSMVTGLPAENIVMVKAGGVAFSRARALNILHEASCHLETCLVTRLDVDMEVRADFFQHAVEAVYLRQVPPPDQFNEAFRTSDLPDSTPTAYFPIIWSAFNPDSIELVEEKFRGELRKENPESVEDRLREKMPEFSEHRGHWRESGKGMYVISGADARKLEFDTAFEGWGGEDVDFYKRVVNLPRRILRGVETGLIHTFHSKFCGEGNDVFTESQIRNCKYAARREEGSGLGQQLLRAKQEENKESNTDISTPKTATARPATAKPTSRIAAARQANRQFLKEKQAKRLGEKAR